MHSHIPGWGPSRPTMSMDHLAGTDAHAPFNWTIIMRSRNSIDIALLPECESFRVSQSIYIPLLTECSRRGLTSYCGGLAGESRRGNTGKNLLTEH